jgi:hypothetical protein
MWLIDELFVETPPVREIQLLGDNASRPEREELAVSLANATSLVKSHYV